LAQLIFAGAAALLPASPSRPGPLAVAETLKAFIARERVRLTNEREAIKTHQQELEAKLSEITKELTAIDAHRIRM
jgi:hypothetical protein